MKGRGKEWTSFCYLYYVCLCVGPNSQECGNGIIEGDEECDCGSKDQEACRIADPCCTTNCTLREGALCRYVYSYDVLAISSISVCQCNICLLYTSPSPRDATLSRMPSSA